MFDKTELNFRSKSNDCPMAPRKDAIMFVRVKRNFGEPRKKYLKRAKARLLNDYTFPHPNYDYSPTGKWFQSKIEVFHKNGQEWKLFLSMSQDV